MNRAGRFGRQAAIAGFALLLLSHPSHGATPDWMEIKPSLAPTDRAEGDQFGAAVAVGKNVIAIGAYLADAKNGKDSGRVYLYKKENKSWSQLTPLTGKSADEWFGFDVAIDAEGKKLIVGAPNPRGKGHAYVYDLVDTTKELPLAEGVSGDEFGSSVATNGTWVAVGARGADRRAGRVYVFPIDGKNTNFFNSPESTPGREFGQCVAFSGMTLVVGEPLPGENGQSAGAAYVYGIKDGVATLRRDYKFSPAGLAAGAAFGYSVAISDERIIVGAPLSNQESGAVYRLSGKEWEPLSGVSQKGDQFGIAIAMSGSDAIVGARHAKDGAGTAYSYTWGDNPWELVHLPNANAEFGFGVAISGDVLVVGAFKEGGSGTAYVFERLPQTVTLSFALSKDATQAAHSDDQPPEIQNVNVPEGEEIPAVVVLKTSDDGALRKLTTVVIEAIKGTAKAGDDYTFTTSGNNSNSKYTFVFKPGESLSSKVPLSILADCLDEEEETFTLSLSGSPEAQVDNSSKLKVSIQDADLTGDIDITPPPRDPKPWTTSESGTVKTFGVKLTCKPTNTVFLTLASTKESEGKVISARHFEFSTENWYTERFVTVKGQEDRACDGLEEYKIGLTLRSDDPAYDRPDDPKMVDLENEDNGDVCPEATICTDGGTIVYAVKIENTSGTNQMDLADPEILEELPKELTLVTASADLGVVTMDYIRNEVGWNGSIPKEAKATIQIVATLEPMVDPGTLVIFTGTYHYGSREALFEVSFRAGEAEPCAQPE